MPPQTHIRLAEPPLPVPAAGSANCTIGCLTKQGKPKQANIKCISHMCSDCCAAATKQAFNQNQECDACKTHRQHLVRTCTGSPPLPPAVQLADVPAQFLIQPVAATIPILPGVSSVGSQPASALTQSRDPQPSGSSKRKSNGRSLAQPIGPAWTSNHMRADGEAQQVQSLKMKNELLVLQMK